MDSSNTRLQPDKIKLTAEKLSKRIAERFPDSGLYRISCDLHTLAEKAENAAADIARPIYWVRLSGAVLISMIVAIVLSLLWVGFAQIEHWSDANIVDVIGGLEAGTNELILFGLAIFFLINLEARIKRARIAPQIHTLRALAHVIDMHQLTKDPASYESTATRSSPVRNLSLPELVRYLDYCSEMLSINSKIAAVYVQDFSDDVVINAVSDVEQLCAGLARKIWQKVSIAESIIEDRKRRQVAGL